MTGKGQIAPTAEDIEALARLAVERLPAAFSAHLDDVLLIVEDFAENAMLAELDIDDPFALSGLYQGRPIAESAQTGDPPSTIHLYRRPIIDEWAESGEDLGYLVAHIVVHEIGHHFGLSDADMHKLEALAS